MDDNTHDETADETPRYQQGTPANLEGVGSTIATAIKTVEEYTKPIVMLMTEPETGIEAPVIIGKDGVQALPESVFDQYRDTPKHRRGTATLLSVDSFVEHVNRFSDEDSVIFADNDRAKPSLTAVLDYHRAGAASDARFGKHRSVFAFPLADEWKAWNAKNAVAMKMIDFAQFLEDRIIDVLPVTMVSLEGEAKMFVDTLGGTGKIADPSKLMQLATEFQVLENSVVKSANNLATGETQIVFETEHLDGAGQKLTVPSLFVLGIPVYHGEPPYQVLARLRYRKSGQQITFWYELWRTDRVFDHAFDEAVAKVKAATSRPVFLGRDEDAVTSSPTRF